MYGDNSLFVGEKVGYNTDQLWMGMKRKVKHEGSTTFDDRWKEESAPAKIPLFNEILVKSRPKRFSIKALVLSILFNIQGNLSELVEI